jgi:hypothetical protein
MKRLIITLSIAVLFAAFAGVHTSFALNLGDNITISDLNSSNDNDWYGDREDQETEPGTTSDQAWDLEGMFLDGTKLSLVGGYDFMNGNGNIYTGDIFIDVDGDIKYGTDVDGVQGVENEEISNVFGYDYVIDISAIDDGLNFTYNIYAIDEQATLLSPYYDINYESGAFRYDSGGELIGSGDLTYQTGLSDDETGFLGGSHNALSVDLDFLAIGTEFTAHYTMGCGNDDLMGAGKTTTPTATPEPGTLLLLGGGLFAIISIIRKRNA